MDLLLSLEFAASQHSLKGLRCLFYVMQPNVRNVRALGVSSESYCGPLSSILMNKLLPEICLIISRELSESVWDLNPMMEVIERELETREQSVDGLPVPSHHKPNLKSPPQHCHWSLTPLHEHCVCAAAILTHRPPAQL